MAREGERLIKTKEQINKKSEGERVRGYISFIKLIYPAAKRRISANARGGKLAFERPNLGRRKMATRPVNFPAKMNLRLNAIFIYIFLYIITRYS